VVEIIFRVGGYASLAPPQIMSMCGGGPLVLLLVPPVLCPDPRQTCGQPNIISQKYKLNLRYELLTINHKFFQNMYTTSHLRASDYSRQIFGKTGSLKRRKIFAARREHFARLG
jgi:hypothetical protein